MYNGTDYIYIGGYTYSHGIPGGVFDGDVEFEYVFISLPGGYGVGSSVGDDA